MKATKIIIATAFASLATAAMAAGSWVAGYGQGTFEYSVEDGKGDQLYIACPSGQNAYMMATIKGVTYGAGSDKKFTLIIDGKSVEGLDDTSSQVGANNFIFAWDKLRVAKNVMVRTQDGKSFVVPMANAGKVMPKSYTKNFACEVFQ